MRTTHARPIRLRVRSKFPTRADRKLQQVCLLTFGLLSPNKGIENVIRALPAILARHPRVVYIVSGVTHPHIRRRDQRLPTSAAATLTTSSFHAGKPSARMETPSIFITVRRIPARPWLQAVFVLHSRGWGQTPA